MGNSSNFFRKTDEEFLRSNVVGMSKEKVFDV